MAGLAWLPAIDDWRPRLRAILDRPPGLDPDQMWQAGMALAKTGVDFVRTNGLDQAVFGALAGAVPGGLAAPPIRLAILGSATFAHLHAAIRVAGLRRNLHVTVYENGFGQYVQELGDPGSALHAFRPNAVLLALDAPTLSAGLHAGMREEEARAALEQVQDRIRACWRMARDAFGCQVIHQTPLPSFPPSLGNNEHRLRGRARPSSIG